MGHIFDLKPCPFCGGKSRLFVNDGVCVLCTKCGATSKILVDCMTTSGTSGCAVESVIKAWNQRTMESTRSIISDENTILLQSISAHEIDVAVLNSIDYLLSKKKISHRQFAIQAGIPVSTINSMFARKSNVTIAFLKSVSDVIGVNVVIRPYEENKETVNATEAEEKNWVAERSELE